jgi:uncharacterized protein YodC (DUF2158 family)
MANETFKVGDTVELKSGGPKMGVANVDGENVRCEWSDGHVAHSAAAERYFAVRLVSLVT